MAAFFCVFAHDLIKAIVGPALAGKRPVQPMHLCGRPVGLRELMEARRKRALLEPSLLANQASRCLSHTALSFFAGKPRSNRV